MKASVFLLLMISILYSASAQKLAVSADKQKILIGEPFHLHLQVNFHSGEALDFFEVDSIPRFEILDRSEIDTSKFGDGLALIQNLTLTSWDSGKIQIAPFVLGKDRTKALTIDVAYSPSPFDTTKPYHDIHDILEVKRPVESTWYWYLIGLLVLILLFLLFFPKAKPRPAGVFYTELVQTFREYLHKRMNVYSFSKTTEDLSMQIEKLNLDKEEYEQLVQTLLLSDFVKYAKYQSSTEEKRNAVESVRNGIISIENTYTSNLKPQTSNL